MILVERKFILNLFLFKNLFCYWNYNFNLGFILLNCYVFWWKFIFCFCREFFEEFSLKSDDLKEIGLIDFEFVGDL